MKNIIIIGLGNIGKRHLQSFLSSNESISIICVDKKFPKSQKFDKRVIKKTSIENFKINFDICIISTNSKERFLLLKSFLSKNTCKNIILEKIIFSNMNQYLEAVKISNKKSNIYINCPRRSWDSYIKLKNKLNFEHIKLFEINGYNWGLLSNAIHFIDLFSFLTNDKKLDYVYQNCSSIKLSSKRIGYIESNGSIIFQNSNRSLLILNDHKYFKDKNIINIKTEKKTYEINEFKNLITIKNTKETILKVSKFSTYLQSDISKNYLSNISLVSIKNSIISHKALYDCFKEIFPNKKIFPVS